jgi:uncharacterized membrane protein YbhN (UPF0104 family)
LRRTGAALILGVVVWRLGTGPFVTGLRRVSLVAVVAAMGIAVVTTGCAAYRWRLVARGLGIGIGFFEAVAAYYRAQFLNTALPGGVLGDVHRGIRNGRDSGDLGRGVRAVVWERCAGQAVQIALAIGVLVVFPSPIRTQLLIGAGCAAFGCIALWFAARWAAGRACEARWVRAARAARDELGRGVMARDVWPGIVLASVVVVAGHAATFVIAADTGGAHTSLPQLLPLTFVVLLATALPVNVAGWGPREGVAAWAFGAAGLGAAQGVAAATAYGVLVIASTLPGAVVLFVGRRRSSPDPSESARPLEAAMLRG